MLTQRRFRLDGRVRSAVPHRFPAGRASLLRPVDGRLLILSHPQGGTHTPHRGHQFHVALLSPLPVIGPDPIQHNVCINRKIRTQAPSSALLVSACTTKISDVPTTIQHRFLISATLDKTRR